MLLFFQTRRDLAAYFSALKQQLAGPAIILKPSQSIVPCLKTLLSCHHQQFAEAIEYKVIEKRYARQRELHGYERWFYRAKSAWLYAADIRTLRKHAITRVVVWNGLKYRQSLLVMAAQQQGIGLIYMENGLLPETTVCDARGVNAGNALPRDPAFYQQLPASLPAFVPANLVARASVSPKKGSARALPASFIFIPFQVDSDSQIIKYSPWIKNMQQLFTACCQAAGDNVQLVFKEHPSSHVNYDHLHNHTDSRVMFANDYATQELIQKAEAVITINSTVGIEALCYNKKVIVLGEACYAIDGLVLTASSTPELARQLQHLQRFEPDAPLRSRFLAYLQHSYLVKGDWRHCDAEHVQAMARRIESLVS